MKYLFKVYKWEDGQKTVELTAHCIQPIFYEDRLDETLDTGEIILEAMPISTRNDFPPKTKIRIEQYIAERNYEDEPFKLDMIVEHDDVEEYVGFPLCTHRISLIEASAVAQGMHVDNIALTYELQDVDLNYKTIVESTDNVVVDGGNSQGYDTAVKKRDIFSYPVIGGGGEGSQ